MKTCIVTGGAGFIGSHLSKRLISIGKNVIILDDLSTGYIHNIPDGATFIKVDISDHKKIESLSLPKSIDTIYHFAAQSSGEASFDNPLRDIEINYKATYNMLKLAENKRSNRFIYASTMSVYGDISSNETGISETNECIPVSYYGCNKFASEKLIWLYTKEKPIIPTILRLFSVYGPGQNMTNMKQGMISIYLSYIMKNKTIIVKGNLDRMRDFIFIGDLIYAVVACEDNENTYNKCFNLGSGVKITIEELLTVILKIFGKSDFNKWIKKKGNTPGDIKGFFADISKIKNALCWIPEYSINSGIKDMKNWINSTNIQSNESK